MQHHFSRNWGIDNPAQNPGQRDRSEDPQVRGEIINQFAIGGMGS